MPTKDRSSPESDTQPGKKKPGASGPGSKRKHSASADTLPPPPPSARSKTPAARPARTTARPPKRKPHGSDIRGARVDEVVADMTKDPRREKD
jgi:hypothetical protein